MSLAVDLCTIAGDWIQAAEYLRDGHRNFRRAAYKNAEYCCEHYPSDRIDDAIEEFVRDNAYIYDDLIFAFVHYCRENVHEAERHTGEYVDLDRLKLKLRVAISKIDEEDVKQHAKMTLADID